MNVVLVLLLRDSIHAARHACANTMERTSMKQTNQANGWESQHSCQGTARSENPLDLMQYRSRLRFGFGLKSHKEVVSPSVTWCYCWRAIPTIGTIRDRKTFVQECPRCRTCGEDCPTCCTCSECRKAVSCFCLGFCNLLIYSLSPASENSRDSLTLGHAEKGPYTRPELTPHPPFSTNTLTFPDSKSSSNWQDSSIRAACRFSLASTNCFQRAESLGKFASAKVVCGTGWLEGSQT